ncbi:MAG: hypothetical protein WC501_02215 [Candidatus Micrarchaeia archaeon]
MNVLQLKPVEIKQGQQILMPLGKEVSYLAARELLRNVGGLPSIKDMKNYVSLSDLYPKWAHQNSRRRFEHNHRYIIENDIRMWVREILATPSKYQEIFEPGKDFVFGADWCSGKPDRITVIPASLIPDIAFDRKKVALFIDPDGFEIDDKRVVIYAKPENVSVFRIPEKKSFKNNKIWDLRIGRRKKGFILDCEELNLESIYEKTEGFECSHNVISPIKYYHLHVGNFKYIGINAKNSITADSVKPLFYLERNQDRINEIIKEVNQNIGLVFLQIVKNASLEIEKLSALINDHSLRNIKMLNEFLKK